MKEQMVIEAAKREGTGSAVAGRLRRGGEFPAVVYRRGEPAEPIRLKRHAFELMLQRHHSEHMMLDLAIDGEPPRRVLLKDIQHHPLTGAVMHVDFHEVAMDERLRVAIPIELVGEPEGVRNQGGILDHLLREVEVECLPNDLMEQIDVDVSALTIGDSLAVSSIQLDADRYEIVTDGDVLIAAVSAPRTEEEEETAEEGAEGAEEPELVKGETEEKAEE